MNLPAPFKRYSIIILLAAFAWTPCTSFAAKSPASSANTSNKVYQFNKMALTLLRNKGKSPSEATKQWFARLAKEAQGGNADAQCCMGHAYARGVMVPKNSEKALQWYQAAAKQGQAEAQYNLGEFYEEGKGGLTPNAKEAALWYYKAAKGGFVQAQETLAWLFITGKHGVRQDPQEAVKWLQASSRVAGQELSVQDAEYEIASSLMKEAVSRQDWERVAWWMQQAAEHGHLDAQYQLGKFYTQGVGLALDYNKAARWFYQAAKQDQVEAQYALAMAYDRGTGVQQSYIKAQEWYSRAARQGHAQARQQLQAMQHYLKHRPGV